MSIENKLTYLDGTKDAIKQAIIGKGVSVTEADTFRSYATKIEEIQSGGSGGDCPQGVLNLRDWTGSSFNVLYELKEIILPSNLDNVSNMSSCFSGCSSLTSITLPDLPNVTNMYYCFYNCRSLTSLTLPSSLSKVLNMSNCFGYCESLTSITLPSNLLNVTNMDSCFKDCSSLTSITLPSSLSKVLSMGYCFSYCESLTSITLPDLSNVTKMYGCFWYCTSLTSITLPDLPKVTDMKYCFYSCESLRNLVIGNINPNISTLTNWNISDCTLLTVDSLVNIMNALPTTSSTKTCTIGTTNINKLSPEQLAIGTNKGWSIN